MVKTINSEIFLTPNWLDIECIYDRMCNLVDICPDMNNAQRGVIAKMLDIGRQHMARNPGDAFTPPGDILWRDWNEDPPEGNIYRIYFPDLEE